MRPALVVVLCLLPAARADEAVTELLLELAHRDEYVRAGAREQLARRGEDVVPALVHAFDGAGVALRLQLALVLGEIGPEAGAAAPVLAKQLAAPDDALRRAAAGALGRIGPDAEPAVPRLLEFARSERWADRFAAADALLGIGPAAVEPALYAGLSHLDGLFAELSATTAEVAADALTHEDARVREWAARALAAARSPQALPALRAALNDKSGAVRRQAALAIGALGFDAAPAIPDLVDLAEDPGRRAVVPALRALGDIVRAAAHRRPPAQLKSTRDAIALGLWWLVRHQDADGSWDAANFDKHAPENDKNGGPGQPSYSLGVSGVALCALLGADDLDLYEEPLRAGLRALVARQEASGLFGPRGRISHYIYNHLGATLAMCRAWRVLEHPVYGRAAQRGLDFLAARRNPDLAWRYNPGDNDTSITAWAVACLHEGELGGLRVGRDNYRGALAWTERMTHPDTGVTGYHDRGGETARPDAMKARFPPHLSRAMTAAGLHIRYLCGQRPATTPVMQRSLARVLEILPRWEAGGWIDMYAWFHGSRVMHYAGPKYWRKWTTPLHKAVVPHQHPKRSGNKAGSWDPAGPWGNDGGRVYATALMVLCLQTPGMTPLDTPLPRQADVKPAVKYLLQALLDPRDEVREAAQSALAGFKLR